MHPNWSKNENIVGNNEIFQILYFGRVSKFALNKSVVISDDKKYVKGFKNYT